MSTPLKVGSRVTTPAGERGRIVKVRTGLRGDWFVVQHRDKALADKAYRAGVLTR